MVSATPRTQKAPPGHPPSCEGSVSHLQEQPTTKLHFHEYLILHRPPCHAYRPLRKIRFEFSPHTRTVLDGDQWHRRRDRRCLQRAANDRSCENHPEQVSGAAFFRGVEKR